MSSPENSEPTTIRCEARNSLTQVQCAATEDLLLISASCGCNKPTTGFMCPRHYKEIVQDSLVSSAMTCDFCGEPPKFSEPVPVRL